MSNFPGVKGPPVSNFPGRKGPPMSKFPGRKGPPMSTFQGAVWAAVYSVMSARGTSCTRPWGVRQRDRTPLRAAPFKGIHNESFAKVSRKYLGNPGRGDSALQGTPGRPTLSAIVQLRTAGHPGPPNPLGNCSTPHCRAPRAAQPSRQLFNSTLQGTPGRLAGREHPCVYVRAARFLVRPCLFKRDPFLTAPLYFRAMRERSQARA